MTQRTVLQTAAALAAEYLAGLPTRSVAPTPAALARLRSLDRPLPDGPVRRSADRRGRRRRGPRQRLEGARSPGAGPHPRDARADRRARADARRPAAAAR